MRLLVGSEVGSVGEGPVAVRAAERAFPGVRPDVALQQPRTRERFAAHWTAARQRVRPHVHLQSAHRVVDLPPNETHMPWAAIH